MPYRDSQVITDILEQRREELRRDIAQVRQQAAGLEARLHPWRERLRRAGLVLLGAAVGTVIVFLAWPDARPAFESPSRKGMTWVKLRHDRRSGEDTVGCKGCDTSRGDTSCTEARPILCLRVDHSPSRAYNPPGWPSGWAQGHVGLTTPVLGTALSLGAADAQCAATFGKGFRMAMSSDGENDGHGNDENVVWAAVGNLDDRYDLSTPAYDATRRFWVYNPRRPANCWDAPAPR